MTLCGKLGDGQTRIEIGTCNGARAVCMYDMDIAPWTKTWFRCVDAKTKAVVNREAFDQAKQRDILREDSQRIYEHSICSRTAVDSVPLFANVFANESEVCFSILQGPCTSWRHGDVSCMRIADPLAVRFRTNTCHQAECITVNYIARNLWIKASSRSICVEI